MIGALFSKFKIYIIAAAIVGAFAGGVTVTNWYHKAQKASALEKVIKKHGAEVGRLEAVIAVSATEKKGIKLKFRNLNKRLTNVKATCSIPYDSDVIRVWDDSGNWAGGAKTD